MSGGWNVILSALTSLGISAATVFCYVTLFLGKRIDKYLDGCLEIKLEKNRSKLEGDKGLLLENISIRKRIIENQYERTINDYPIIWEAIINFVNDSVNLKCLDKRPDGDFSERKKELDKSMKRWIRSRDNLRGNIMSRAPFYPKEHYDMFMSILDKGIDIKEYLDDKDFLYQVNMEKLTKMHTNIQEEQENTLTAIRDYLKEYRLENIDDPRKADKSEG